MSCPYLLEQAVHSVPIFTPLSMEQKRLVADALVEVHFRSGLHICEEVKYCIIPCRHVVLQCPAPFQLDTVNSYLEYELSYQYTSSVP